MTQERILTKTYRWMIISDDGLLKTPANCWGEEYFKYGYSTEQEAVEAYQSRIDNNFQWPCEMVLIAEFKVSHVF